MTPLLQFFNSRRRCLGMVALAALIPPGGNAAAIYGGTGDTDVRSDGTVVAATANSLLPGGSGSPALDRSSVYVFQLPDLGAVAAPFVTADFRFNFASLEGTPPNVDLYGLGRRNSPAVLAQDYYGGTTTVDTSDATFLQHNILTSGAATGLISTNTSGGTALASYLNSQYAGGAGVGESVFLRLSTDTPPGGVKRYTLTAADSGSSGAPDTRPQIIYNVPTGYARPFIWVRDAERAGILAKIANHAWAASVCNGMISRVAADVASHQADPDGFLRQLPVDWTQSPARFKTIPTYAESAVRGPAESKFNDGLDCAVLYYLTGDVKYASCAADILHNAVKTLLPVAPSTSASNGGWIFQNDFLKEARVTGTQLPIIYDFLHSYLQSHQVHDVQTAGMVNFNFTNAQGVFRTLYQLARDHGQKDSNWSALMSTCMLNSLLALDDAAERNAALQVYLTTGSSRQASLDYDYRYYTQPGDIWPESLQYAGAVGSIRTSHLVLLERVDPGLNLFDSYPNLPLSLPRISYLRYPNGQQVSFGDGHRDAGGQPFSQYELVYQHALARGRTDLTSFFGSLINGGVADGNYNRSALRDYSSLGQHNEPLQLLWQSPDIAEPGVSPEPPRTDTLPFAGIALQRNPAPSDNSTYGLMCFVGGAGHVHSHASGMSMELFGMGQVMGAKSGVADYGSTLHENYYRLFASNNTVIVNGGSRGQGGWSDIAINTVQTVAMEPQPLAPAVSPDFSFTCSSFADNKGTLAEGTQQRTMAIIRTSPTSGFYLDLFRSKSTVTNRVATTLDGSVTDQYHDYIYRNIGETTVDLTADGAALPLVCQTNRFQNDIGDAYDQPGWRYFTNPTVSHPTSQPARARFVATVSGTTRYMDLHLPAVASREYAKVDSPAIVDAPSPYHTRAAPALVVRQIGEAWDKAFAAVYEPHFGSSGTVRNVTRLLRGGTVVGVKVESTVLGKNLVQYVISNPGAAETYTDVSSGLSFTGRFGVASDNGDGTTTLYLGSGSSLSYRGNSVATVSGANSQAEVRFAPGRPPAVTANTPVTVVGNPAIDATWLAVAGSPGLAWNDAANWSPAVAPNGVGSVASMNIDISGDQTIILDEPIKLGQLVIGDTAGDQSMTLKTGVNGALVFERSDDPMACLLRGAGGTGEVTLGEELHLTLNNDLTVGLTAGAAVSTMRIGGDIAGSRKGLTKESDGLTLILSADTSFSGAAVINGGILQLGDAGTTGGLHGTAGITVNGGVLAVNRSNTFTQAADLNGREIAGAGGFSQLGSGTTVLSVANGYAGDTTVSAGILQLGAGDVIPDGAGKGNVSVGGTLDLNGHADTVNGLNGTGIVDNTAADTHSILTVGGDNQSSSFGGILQNTGGSATLDLVKTGSGTLVLGGANTLGGSVTVGGGTLAFTHTSPLNSVSGIAMAGGTTLRPDVVNAVIDAPVTIGTSGTTVTINAPSVAGGGGTSAVPLTLGGAISGAGNVTFRGIENSNAYGRIVLNGASSYKGSTMVTTSGGNRNLFLRLGTDSALPGTTVLTLDGGNGAGSGRFCELNLNGHNQTLAGLTNVAQTLRTQRVFNTSATTATLTINDNDHRTYSGQLGNTTADNGNFSLTKGGGGTFTLSGPIGYAGNTTVTGGTLVLGNPNASNDLSTVTIAASGAKLQLTYAGTDTVGRLFIGTAQQPAGVYGHTDSGATNGGLGVGAMDAHFGPGSGTLTVVGGYRSWAATNAPTGTAADDYDGDGVGNAVEYVLGGTTATNDCAKLPEVSISGDNLLFSFERDQASIDGSTTVTIEASVDLTNWTTRHAVPDGAANDSPGVAVRMDTPTPGTDSITLTLPAASDTRKFFRLKVTMP